MNLADKILYLIAEKIIVQEHTDEATAQSRLAVCETCEHRSAKKNKCNVCGCFLALKTICATNYNLNKKRNEVTHCPLGKWQDLEITNQYRKLDGLEPLTA